MPGLFWFGVECGGLCCWWVVWIYAVGTVLIMVWRGHVGHGGYAGHACYGGYMGMVVDIPGMEGMGVHGGTCLFCLVILRQERG